jgi:hypothetical protein
MVVKIILLAAEGHHVSCDVSDCKEVGGRDDDIQFAFFG